MLNNIIDNLKNTFENNKWIKKQNNINLIITILLGILIFIVIIIFAFYFVFSNKNNIPATKINFLKEETTIKVGETEKLYYYLTPTNATNNKLLCISTNTNVVSISKDLILKGISSGEAKIICYNDKLSQSLNVTIVNQTIDVESILIHGKNRLSIGESTNLHLSIYPNNATNQNIKWESSNNNIASISDYGLVTAKSEGEVLISATVDKKTTHFKLEVIPMEIISIDITPKNIQLYVTETEILIPTIYPNNANNKNLTWISSNSNVATVNNGTIKAINPGTTTITVSSTNGKTASVYVTVKERVIDVQSISVNKSNLTLEKGTSETIIATINPNNATNKNLTWNSSNSNVATVNNGTIKAINPGTATITVSSTNGKIASVYVTVKNNQIVIDNNIVNYLNTLYPNISINCDKSNNTKTLKYCIQKEGGHYLTFIKVNDAYKQVRKVSALVARNNGQVVQETTPTKMQLDDMLNIYTKYGIIDSRKLLLAFNASWWNTTNNYGSFYKGRGTWLSLVNGQIVRARYQSESWAGQGIMGITSSGQLKYYPTNYDEKSKRAQLQNIQNDGVLDTYSANGLFIQNGIIGDTNEIDKWGSARRQAICQVNNNLFIMYSSTNNEKAKIKDIATMFKKLNCQTAINLDGGGSTYSYLRESGTDKFSAYLQGDGRSIENGIYFQE